MTYIAHHLAQIVVVNLSKAYVLQKQSRHFNYSSKALQACFSLLALCCFLGRLSGHGIHSMDRLLQFQPDGLQHTRAGQQKQQHATQMSGSMHATGM
jgi:hypothetical protein